MSGEGQHIDLSLLDTVVSMMANQGQNFFVGGSVPGRTGAEHPNLAPYRTFATRDGHLIIAVGNDSQFRKLCDVLERPDLANDPRYATNAGRVHNRRPLAIEIETATLKWHREALIDALSTVDVPCGPINDLAEVFNDPQVQHRGLKITLPHALAGAVTGIRNPLLFSSTPAEYTRAPPQLGEHTEDVLTRVAGFTPAEIVRLRENKIL